MGIKRTGSIRQIDIHIMGIEAMRNNKDDPTKTTITRLIAIITLHSEKKYSLVSTLE